MISEFNVTLIVTTCNLAEKGRTKCHKFWMSPSDVGEDQTLAFAPPATDAQLAAELEQVGITVRASGAEL